jgi:hypothetical protein
MRGACELLLLLEEAKGEFNAWAKPFVLLAEQIAPEIEPLAFARPNAFSRENLEKQLYLVEYYLAKGHIVEAVTLAREWVVSYVLLFRGGGDWLRRSDRAEAEKALGAATAHLQGGTVEPPPEWFGPLLTSAGLADLWNKLGQLRNDLAHCGMSTDARSARAIDQDAGTIPGKLRPLLESAPDAVLHGARVVVDLRTFYEGTARLDQFPNT